MPDVPPTGELKSNRNSAVRSICACCAFVNSASYRNCLLFAGHIGFTQFASITRFAGKLHATDVAPPSHSDERNRTGTGEKIEPDRSIKTCPNHLYTPLTILKNRSNRLVVLPLDKAQLLSVGLARQKTNETTAHAPDAPANKRLTNTEP